ncbi:hypothetical protein LR013_03175 [candidate division NPL-UPA2 bacterium]|nr:hypothetical protein [candidate division NPL-UPA2 bacterium]
MVDRNEALLKMLNKAMLFEESAIVILGSTYCTFVEEDKVAGLKAAQKKRVIGILDYLIKDSEKHGNLLRGLIGRISQKERDAS